MGKFDVVKDYDWTSIPRGAGMRKKAPRVWVKSYKFNKNQVINRFETYVQVIKDRDTEAFYDKLYGDATSPEDDFNFPFFNENIRSFSNTFGDTFQNGFGGGGGIGEGLDSTAQTYGGHGAHLYTAIGADAFDAVGKVYNSNLSDIEKTAQISNLVKEGLKRRGDPGSYIETPKMYQYEQNDGPLEVTFVLSNTINSDYTKNHELVKHLTKICRPFRKNAIAMDPPRIFQVKVPGQRFIKWASCSNFSVNLLGTKREIGGVVTPEAYQISMSFTSLTVEASNFMDKI